MHAVTLDDDARVADLLARLGDGDSRELFRRLLEAGMQELIDAELTAAIGTAPHEWTRPREVTTTTTVVLPAAQYQLVKPRITQLLPPLPGARPPSSPNSSMRCFHL